MANLSHVTVACEAHHSAFLIQHSIDFVEGIAKLIDQIEDHGLINISDSGSHNQTIHRPKSHAGVYTFSVFDRGYTAAVSQVDSDDFRFLFSNNLNSPLRHILVTDPMEAIGSHSVCIVVFIWYSHPESHRRNSLMKCSIEYDYLI